MPCRSGGLPCGAELTGAGPPLRGSCLMAEPPSPPAPAPAWEGTVGSGSRAAPCACPHLRESPVECSFRKKHVELGEEKLPMSYNLKKRYLIYTLFTFRLQRSATTCC